MGAVSAELPAVAGGSVLHTEDAMTNAEAWVTLVMGAILGIALGFAAAWRLARKLEHHGVRLAAWDADDWQETQARATARLRGEVTR